MVDELNTRSDVPRRLARRWIETEQIVALLDGLDEVAADSGEACVKAINEFRRDHGLMPIAVCSRIADYEALGARLRLTEAVVIQPLTKPRVQEYLARAGTSLSQVTAALDHDPELWDLLDTPLMLWVTMLAMRGGPVELAEPAGGAHSRRQLFAAFVDAMFRRRAVIERYPRAQTIHWLSWLAVVLRQHSETVFRLESIRRTWLPAGQQWLSRVLVAVATGLLVGVLHAVIFGIVNAPWLMGMELEDALGAWTGSVLATTLIGMLIGLTVEFTDVPGSTVRLTLTGLSGRIRPSARAGLRVGARVGAMVGVLAGLYGGIDAGVTHAESAVAGSSVLHG